MCQRASALKHLLHCSPPKEEIHRKYLYMGKLWLSVRMWETNWPHLSIGNRSSSHLGWNPTQHGVQTENLEIIRSIREPDWCPPPAFVPILLIQHSLSLNSHLWINLKKIRPVDDNNLVLVFNKAQQIHAVKLITIYKSQMERWCTGGKKMLHFSCSSEKALFLFRLFLTFWSSAILETNYFIESHI